MDYDDNSPYHLNQTMRDTGYSSRLNLSITTSLKPVRRIHDNGVKMLESHTHMREMEKRAKQMENRIKNLKDKEAKAIKYNELDIEKNK